MIDPIWTQPPKRFVAAPLVLWLGVALVTATIGVGAFIAWYLRHEALRDAAADADYTVGVVEEQIAQVFDQIDLGLRDGTATAAPLLAGAERNAWAGHRELRVVVGRFRHWFALAVFDIEGNVIVDSRQHPPASRSIADAEHFRVHRDGRPSTISIGVPAIDQADARASIPISRPIRAEDGRFLGVIAAAVDPDYFLELFRVAMKNREDAAALSLNDGRFLVRLPQRADVLGKSFPTDPALKLLSAGEKAAVYTNRSPLDGIERTVGLRALARYPVFARIGFSNDAISRRWLKQAVLISGSSGAAALALSVLTWAAYRRARAYDVASEFQRIWTLGIQNSPRGVLLADPTKPDMPIIYANPGFEALTGYRVEEVIGKNCRFLQGPDTDPEARAILRRAIETGDMASVEILNYRKDAKPFWNRVDIYPVKNEAGAVTHFIGRQLDVTVEHESRERQNEAWMAAEAALQQLELAKSRIMQSEARFRDFAEAASDLFWETDAELRLAEISAHGDQGRILPAAVGQALPELIETMAEDGRILAANLRRDLSERRPIKDVEIEAVADWWYRFNGKAFYDTSENFLGYRGTARDISEEKRARRAIGIERERLAMAVENLSESFALYGADDRLIFCNARYREINDDIAGRFVKPGALFESVIRHAVSGGRFPKDVASAEEWIARRFEYHRNPDSPLLMHMSDGRSVLISEQRFPDGSWAAIATEITTIERVWQRLNVVIDTIDAGFALFEADDRLAICNRRYADLMARLFPDRPAEGVSFDEILDRMVQSGAFVPDRPADREGWPENFRHYHRHPTEAPFILRSDENRVIHVVSRLTKEGSCVCVLSDVTALLETEKALRESDARFRELVEASPDAMIVIDERGMIELANQQMRMIFGYSEEEFARMTVDQLVPESLRPRHPELRAKYLRDPSVRPMGLFRAVVGRRKDGTEVPLEIALNSVVSRGRRVAIATIRDITEKLLAEQALRRSQKMEALGTLAGGIAHDLNNTLSPVLMLASALREDMPPNSILANQLKTIEDSAVRARELVEQILSFSRGDSSERAPIVLSQVVEELRGLLRASVPATIELQFDIDDPDTIILANRTAVHQIVLNLVKNGADAIGDRVGRISIAVRRQHHGGGMTADLPAQSYAALSVRDSGAGMSQETMDRIFEPFFTTKPVGEGTGLGLSIIHGIVKSHGGGIEVSSELGKGTEFRVYLPPVDIRPDGVRAQQAES